MLRHTQAHTNSRRATYTYLFPFFLLGSIFIAVFVAQITPKEEKSDLPISRNRDEEMSRCGCSEKCGIERVLEQAVWTQEEVFSQA